MFVCALCVCARAGGGRIFKTRREQPVEGWFASKFGLFCASKCVLWCFVVFYGVLRVFCGVLRVFCGVLRVFCSISTKHTKHPKNIETHVLKNTKNSQYARVLRAFSKSKKFRMYCTKHLSQNICKTPQNTAKHRKTVTKRVLCNYVAKHRKTNAKRSKSHKTVALQPQPQ